MIIMKAGIYIPRGKRLAPFGFNEGGDLYPRLHDPPALISALQNGVVKAERAV
jgi:hypothetical protein